MIHETHHEFCVVADYLDGSKFCLAKFMHEEDAREYLGMKKPEIWVSYRLYKRYGSPEEPRWEEQEDNRG